MPGFSPNVGESLTLLGQTYTFQAHPGSPSRAYAAEGRRAVVYQVRNGATPGLLALKVFKTKFREPALEEVAGRLMPYRHLQGMAAAERRVVPPTDPAAVGYPNLQYSMLMPWARGRTWFDYLVDLRNGTAYLEFSSALRLCEKFLCVMSGLEVAGIAHTDIAPGNVMVEPASLDIQLIDLEDLYVPGMPPPRHRNLGSAGYRVAGGGEDMFSPLADRYAAGVMAAEMLLLASPALAKLATDEGVFGGHHADPKGREHYSLSEGWLRGTAPDFAQVFRRTWQATRLSDCPSIAELHLAVARKASQYTVPKQGLTVVHVPPALPVSWTPNPAVPGAVPQPPSGVGAGCSCLWIIFLAFLVIGTLPFLAGGPFRSLEGCSLTIFWLFLVYGLVRALAKLGKGGGTSPPASRSPGAS